MAFLFGGFSNGMQHICNVVEKVIMLHPPTKEMPQTIKVVTRQKIENFSFTMTRDILNNTVYSALCPITHILITHTLPN